MKEMNYVMLKEVCSINMGQSPDSDSYNENGEGVPFFQGNADFGERYPVTRKWCTAPTKMAEPEDILISVRAPIGAMNYAKVECCIGRGLAALTPDKTKVSPEFIFWLLKGKNEELNSKGTGSTFKAIGRKVLEETLVPDIALETQLEYSAILEKVYAVIQNRKAELIKLDELIKARFVELFGDPVENPKGYYVATLQELIDKGFITYHLDGNHGGDYPRSEEFVESGVPYISANCIVNGEIDFSKAKYLTPERASKLRKGIAQDEDVLFAHNATVGPTVVLHTSEGKVILGTSLTAYRCNKNVIMPNFLKTYMLSNGFIMQYSSEMKQTTRNQVPITMQKKYLFLIPPIEEQEQFANFAQQVDKSKVAVQKSLEETQLLFDSLMQKYFG